MPVRDSAATIEAHAVADAQNGTRTLEEHLDRLHRDNDLSYQTQKATLDILMEIRNELRAWRPIVRDYQLVIYDMAAEMRAARFDRGGEFATLETNRIPRSQEELDNLRQWRDQEAADAAKKGESK